MKIYQRILSVIVETKKKKSKKRSKKPGSGGSREVPGASEADVAAGAAELRGGITIDPRTGKKIGPVTRLRRVVKQKRKSNPEGVPHSGPGDVNREMP